MANFILQLRREHNEENVLHGYIEHLFFYPRVAELIVLIQYMGIGNYYSN